MGNPPAHRPRKRFGQNFLKDGRIIQRIVDAVDPSPDDRLVEIGPGQGAITKDLLRAAGSLDVVELDRDLVGPLQEMCRELGQLTVHNTDILKFNICSLAVPGQPLRIVGNLPYNISTPILFHLLEQPPCIQDMHFMLQKEVVDRMAASPGGKIYGRLSVMLQARCEVKALFDIPPGAFFPPPKVESTFVRLVPYESPPVEIDDYGIFQHVVTQAFSQRRKTLRNSLRNVLTEKAIADCGIDPGLRAERLSVEEFAKLANEACRIGKLG
jgi:16S rRNA (adenine1518-N6/adenine1519-N6)-dimethyltransferase